MTENLIQSKEQGWLFEEVTFKPRPGVNEGVQDGSRVGGSYIHLLPGLYQSSGYSTEQST